MVSNTGNLAPYAPLANVISLIRRRREKGLPEVLSADKLIQMSIPEGNISRTLQALRFLNLIDDDSRQMPLFNRLALAKANEYPSVLAEVVRGAYHDVFAIIGDNPQDVTDPELTDAFRVYQPEAQRGRMIILFRGLCQEAELIPGGPPDTHMRKRNQTPGKASAPSNGAKKAQPKSDRYYQPEQFQNSEPQDDKKTPPVSSPPITSTYERAIMQGMLQMLPFEEKVWTQSDRERWLKAVAANVDLLFRVKDPEPHDLKDEDMYHV